MDKNVLDILACPFCKGKLRYDKKTQELICRFDKLAFPIIDGVPVMLVEKARTLKDNDNERIK